jgi:hypothetical protein
LSILGKIKVKMEKKKKKSKILKQKTPKKRREKGLNKCILVFFLSYYFENQSFNL